MSLRQRVAGVDFSGARDAGKHIWIAEGDVTPQGVRIDRLQRADSLPNSAAAFDPAMGALVDHVATLTDSIVGFDFPFSLPRELIPERTWPAFVKRFSTEFITPDAFRDNCRQQTGRKELKRRTDTEARVPWCAYNLRLYRQTWAGIRHVLAPIVKNRMARVVPMQTPKDGLPIIAEICPASFLKREGLYFPYKGRGEALQTARSTILTQLARRKILTPVRGALRQTIVTDYGGDALDAVLAAIGAAGVDTALPRDAIDRIEARVYF